MKKKQNIESFLNGLSPLEEDFMRALWSIECGEISDVIPHMVHSEAPLYNNSLHCAEIRKERIYPPDWEEKRIRVPTCHK